MIADMRYSFASPKKGVVVHMFWDEGLPMGKLEVPDHVRRWAFEERLPSLDPLPLMSAITYGMTLAAMNNLDLALSGDASVWPTRWGQLILTM